MECDSIKRFVQKKLREMETVILENTPLYEGNVDVRGAILDADCFMISYEDGFFVISFAYDAPCTLVAIIMKKLALRFEILVGDSHYLSNDRKMYWGDECEERYLADLKKELVKKKSMGAETPPFVEKISG